jgi:cell division protein FtsQ
VTAATGVAGLRVRIDPRLRARRAAVRRDAGRRRLHRLLLGAGVVATLTVAAAVAWSPLLAVHTIVVRGAGPDRAAVRAAARVRPGQPMLLVNAGGVAAAVGRLPTVASARVERDFPNTVTITVSRRVPVAWAPAGPGRAAVLDRHGDVLAVGPGPPAGLPELAGLTRVPGPGGRLHAPAAAAAAALGPSLRGRVTTVVALPGGLVALVANGPQIRFGDGTQLAAKAEAAAAVLAALVAPARYIDVSVPNAPVSG